ncbi:hypothetical protein HZH68_001578 [Vespula germanica]|uniref:Uncharacterized protein n=2 Tax=Vespula TaxID=7451 RepID=A0A834NVW1_VESGE|nr:hypothetical protein HZH68_001578 [Vespula germanica]KAF7439388.1 hypothetical protein H0235_001779 [Vespula pensylvanica]
MCVAEGWLRGPSPRVVSPRVPSSSRRECGSRFRRCAAAARCSCITTKRTTSSSASFAATTGGEEISPPALAEVRVRRQRWGKEAPEAAASPEA